MQISDFCLDWDEKTFTKENGREDCQNFEYAKDIHVLLPKIVWNGLDGLSANENFKNEVEEVFECGEEKQ